MTITASTQNIQSNILAYEDLKEYGFCRLAVGPLNGGGALDNTGDNSVLGSVVVTADAGVTWTPIAQAVVTAGTPSEIGVIIGLGNLGQAIDSDQDEIGTTATENAVILVNGTAIVRKEYLSVAEGAPTDVDVLGAFVEANMVQVKAYAGADQFDGTYSDVDSISN